MKKTQPIAADAATENFFQQLAIKYLPYWPFLGVLLVISLALTYVYLHYTMPIYESTASVLIKDEKKGQEDSKMDDLLNLFNTKKSVENELEIIRSNEVLNEVVTQLHLYAPIYTQRGWRGMMVRRGYLTCPVIMEVADPQLLKDAKKIYFRLAPDTGSVYIGATPYRLTEWVSSPWGKMRFIRNPNFKVNTTPDGDVDTAGYKYYFTLTTITKLTDVLSESLVTTLTSKQSSVILLKIKDPVPEEGEAIISAIVNSYNMNASRKKGQIAANTLNFIEDRLRTVKFQLDSVESSIQNTGTAQVLLTSVSKAGSICRVWLRMISKKTKCGFKWAYSMRCSIIWKQEMRAEVWFLQPLKFQTLPSPSSLPNYGMHNPNMRGCVKQPLKIIQYFLPFRARS